MGLRINNIYGADYPSSRAILLVNLGSPASPHVNDVKKYLTEFLMDERVISIGYFWRSLLVKGIIAPRRSPYSAKNYSKIWEKEYQTFPLIRHSATIAEALSQQMSCPVGLAMRYGAPSMDNTLIELSKLNISEIITIPLYPHYTRSSYETAAVYALERNKQLKLDLNLKLLPPFYAHPLYRKLIADSIRPYLEEPFDRLIVSLHGIPLSHLSAVCRQENGKTSNCLNRPHTHAEQAVCYRLHCETTVSQLQKDLQLKPSQIELVYQSRLGRHEWMRPYFSERIKTLTQEGVQKVLVVCPGFICDCLETIHEIDVEYREEFMRHGGKSFTYIPCLNSEPAFISCLGKIIDEVFSKKN